MGSLELVSIVKFERHMTDASILCIIVNKFGYQQKPDLIILFEIDKDLEVSLYYSILPLPFGLAINLKIESSEKLLFDPKEVIK